MPYIIYADIESLIKIIDGCANDPENSSTIKIGEHILCESSMPTIWAFKSHSLYRCKTNMLYIVTKIV